MKEYSTKSTLAYALGRAAVGTTYMFSFSLERGKLRFSGRDFVETLVHPYRPTRKVKWNSRVVGVIVTGTVTITF